jgi:RND family efflux transporter MFP subunit
MRLLHKLLFGFGLSIMLIASADAQEPFIKSIKITTAQQAAMGVNFVPTIRVDAGSILVSASVTVPPEKQVILSAPYPGQLSQMVVGIGDPVKVGSPLAYFTSPQMGDSRRMLLEASSDARLAKEALARDNELFKEGIIPQSRLNITKAKAENANAMLLARQAELKAAGINFDDPKNKNLLSSYATGALKSPIQGTVVEAYNQIGQRVETGTLLFRIADISTLNLEINTSGFKAIGIQAGDEIIIASRNAKGKVIGVSQAVSASQSARVRAVVEERGSLQMGEIVPATILAKIKPKPQEKPLWQVPARAITNWRGQSAIFVLADGGVSLVPVTVISSDDDLASIQANLASGVRVAVTGIASLKALAQKVD